MPAAAEPSGLNWNRDEAENVRAAIRAVNGDLVKVECDIDVVVKKIKAVGREKIELLYLRSKEEQLRRKEEQLRRDKEQLRRKEELLLELQHTLLNTRLATPNRTHIVEVLLFSSCGIFSVQHAVHILSISNCFPFALSISH
jgi:hypothetical protein